MKLFEDCLNKKLTIRQFIKNDNDFVSYFSKIKLWQNKISTLQFLHQNKIVSTLNKPDLKFEIKLIYETDETVILLRSRELNDTGTQLSEQIFILKIASFLDSSEEKQSNLRYSQIEYLMTKNSKNVSTEWTQIYQKTHDLTPEKPHLSPKYTNKLIILDKESMAVFTATEVIFLNTSLKQY